MNWYKISQLQKTLPYFEEFKEYGDYIPDEKSLFVKLRDKYGVSIISDIGQGDSGVAYLLSNGDVLKITTNKQEGQVAEYLKSNKNQYVIEIKDVWKEGDLYYIIEEKLDMPSTDYINKINEIEAILSQNNCHNPQCAMNILRTIVFDNTLKTEILSYLSFINQMPYRVFDFLNSNNIGMSDGKIKFFDIT
jgi:hypothetical protein